MGFAPNVELVFTAVPNIVQLFTASSVVQVLLMLFSLYSAVQVLLLMLFNCKSESLVESYISWWYIGGLVRDWPIVTWPEK